MDDITDDLKKKLNPGYWERDHSEVLFNAVVIAYHMGRLLQDERLINIDMDVYDWAVQFEIEWRAIEGYRSDPWVKLREFTSLKLVEKRMEV
ncbi:hypothetical protein [Paraburkholderia sp. BL10I2N1]|uniref:hypothetical protein n=1 Tax=Paraburkholderia sp. BL10I2N1 TaxID=1938796 RepID=UPI001061C351|nr:hypothetical protein [Paraburkholderia sp. BL10I2N1]TDN70439.1 hypothetical protein B0G77_3913 [Paraburkholderia sp. BL10I2N1]